MVQPEHGVTGTGKDVSSWIATECEVAAGVDAVEAFVEEALHDGLEPVDVRAVVGDEVVGVGIGVPLRGHPRRDVTLHAAGVVRQTHHRAGDDLGLGECWRHRAKVNRYADENCQSIIGKMGTINILLKGAGFHASSTWPWRHRV